MALARRNQANQGPMKPKGISTIPHHAPVIRCCAYEIRRFLAGDRNPGQIAGDTCEQHDNRRRQHQREFRIAREPIAELMRSVVVLPAPFGPSRARNSPCGIVRSRLSTACVVPKRLFSLSIERAGIGCATLLDLP